VTGLIKMGTISKSKFDQKYPSVHTWQIIKSFCFSMHLTYLLQCRRATYFCYKFEKKDKKIIVSNSASIKISKVSNGFPDMSVHRSRTA